MAQSNLDFDSILVHLGNPPSLLRVNSTLEAYKRHLRPWPQTWPFRLSIIPRTLVHYQVLDCRFRNLSILSPFDIPAFSALSPSK